jgi:hypothetical protein
MYKKTESPVIGHRRNAERDAEINYTTKHKQPEMMKTCFLPLLAALYLSSCHKQDYLNQALTLAGENRPELEKVLIHYKNEPLKLQAAQFLIENMPGHYSYEPSDALNGYYNEIDSVYETWKDSAHSVVAVVYEAIAAKYNLKNLKTVPDVKCVTAGYLIDNIDRSFRLWQNGEWATHVDFDDFCEYILPYKTVEGQTLDNWKTYIQGIYKRDIDSMHYCSTYRNLTFRACDEVNMELKQQLKPKINTERKLSPVKRLRSAVKKPLGTCDDYTFIAASVLRAEGIPVAIDYTPQWAYRNMGHAWNVVLDNFGKNVIFSGCDSRVGTPHKVDHIPAKVFRKTYAINRQLETVLHEEKQLPSTFNSLCIKDVTEEYMKPFDVEVEIKQKTGHRYLYLSVFDNRNWTPIHWGKRSGNTATFHKMGGRIVYLPVCYDNKTTLPIAPPFILDALGNKKDIIPDTTHTQTLKLYRKYPLFPASYTYYQRTFGAKIQASDDPSFKNCVTLYTLRQPGVRTCEARPDPVEKQYRYWRYLSPDGAHCVIAELYFYEKGKQQATYGEIIGTDGSYKNQGKVKNRVFDKNPLTSFDAPEPSGGWVGLDFGKPVNIEKVICVPRGDGNTIIPDNEYELVYWNNNRWNSLGKKIADNTYLQFEACPTNALFLLHNLTTGEEERIFTYENEEQIWW